jgi:5-methylcytosine-specific restriction protein A
MPWRPTPGCSWPLCGKRAEPGCEGRCRAHYLEGKRLTNATYRGKSELKPGGGSRRWQLMREMQLSKEPLCRECLAVGVSRPATQVDHVVPRSHGGTDDEDNLQSLCRAHHNEKNKAERAGTIASPPPKTAPRTGGFA